MGGDFSTNPIWQKVSQRFKYDEMLDDTDCSEFYDDDMFFEGAELRRVPTMQELVTE